MSASGGELIAEALARQGVELLFTLCGGHISPILVAAKRRGIRVVDVRHEATAVFAADAVARLTGVPGVAVVTAGPGVTNTLTAIQNAALAQSPVILLGGATATALKGRGALQDIDQMALVRPIVKFATSVKRVRDLVPALERAFSEAQEGVPGPVFVECPVDLLYNEALVRSWYTAKTEGAAKSLSDAAVKWYLRRHLDRLFAAGGARSAGWIAVSPPLPFPGQVKKAAELLGRAERPLLLVGSQAMLSPRRAPELAGAVTALGIPVYLSGMARGLLGRTHSLQLRQKRREALREADLVILAGTPCDFRLDYGSHIGRSAKVVSVNRSRADVSRNRRPDLGIVAAPEVFLRALVQARGAAEPKKEWVARLRERDEAREAEIAEPPTGTSEAIDPVYLCRRLEEALTERSVLVADGGDFVATASYVVRPRTPLSWLDPGVFGTLGVGAGFAIGAKLCRPGTETWLLWGDGSAGYGLQEFDTFVRHGLPVIALVGNDAGWTQIAREQVEILKDDVGTVLRKTDYHRVAEGFGGAGLLLARPEDVDGALERAREIAREGRPVLVNALLGKTDFRKGSISI